MEVVASIDDAHRGHTSFTFSRHFDPRFLNSESNNYWHDDLYYKGLTLGDRLEDLNNSLTGNS